MSNSIVRYIASLKEGSCGSCDFRIAKTDEILDFLMNDIEAPVALLFAMVRGNIKADKDAFKSASDDLF